MESYGIQKMLGILRLSSINILYVSVIYSQFNALILKMTFFVYALLSHRDLNKRLRMCI